MKPTDDLIIGLISKYKFSEKFREDDLKKIFNHKDFLTDIKKLDSSAGSDPKDGFEDFLINLKRRINGDSNE